MRINKNHFIYLTNPTKFNNKVFGAIFEVEEKFSLRYDAHYLSSDSMLSGSAKQSLHLKVPLIATVIQFENVNELATHRYNKIGKIECITYIINPYSPKGALWLKNKSSKVCKTGTDNHSLSKLLKSTLVQKETKSW